MKKLLVLAMILGGTSLASASDQGAFFEAMENNGVIVQPNLVDCSRVRDFREDCWAKEGESCPSGYNQQARYCKVKGSFKFYRCGWLCESPYTGGGH